MAELIYLAITATLQLYALAFRIAWFLLRTAWWLSAFLILSAGAGAAALARSGRREPDEKANFGRYLENRRFWQEDASGIMYPCSETGHEYCEIHATRAGQYWRRTAISRLMYQDAIRRYRFDAITDLASDGTRRIAASSEFRQEARGNTTLDHVDPKLAGTDPHGLSQNRDLATSALKRMDWILTNCGWEPAGHSADPSNIHWYATRYSRPVISWDAPPAETSPGQ
jgi:hypothetical protein